MFGFQKSNALPNDDSAAQSVAESRTTIRTVKTINGFVKVSERQLQQEQKELEEMKAALERFKKLLSIRIKREELDAEATKTLHAYQSELAKQLQIKQAAVNAKLVQVEKLKLPAARGEWMLRQARESVSAQIDALNDKHQKIAQEKGWDR